MPYILCSCKLASNSKHSDSKVQIGLLNDLRVSSGKSTLGFLNPWIYSHMSSFNDVTTGSNPGCSTEGFPAAKGLDHDVGCVLIQIVHRWDPATGVGTPNYSEMAKSMP